MPHIAGLSRLSRSHILKSNFCSPIPCERVRSAGLHDRSMVTSKGLTFDACVRAFIATALIRPLHAVALQSYSLLANEFWFTNVHSMDVSFNIHAGGVLIRVA